MNEISVWNIGGLILRGWNQRAFWTAYPNAPLFTTCPAWSDLVSNRGLCGDC